MGAVTIAMMVDGDTGYGNPMNVERTVEGFARAGADAVMIADEVAPKRCGHTADKRVVDRAEAAARIRAAVAAGARADILILARANARRAHGLDEAIAREIPAPSMAKLLQGGQSPMLPQDRLAALRAGEGHRTKLMGFAEMHDVLGLDACQPAARRYED